MVMANDIELDSLARLKEEVCRRFGRQIVSHSDSVDLSAQIPARPPLSTQTIKRFFGRLPGNTRPSRETLNIFCQYLGYSGWDSFVDPSSLLLSHELRRYPSDNDFDFYRKDIPAYWEIFYNQNRVKAAEIYSKPDGDKKISFFKALGQIKNAHDTFWEWFPNMNVLREKYYTDGLLSYRDSKNTGNARCYANGMLFLGSFLTKDDEASAVYYQCLIDDADTSEIWPLPLARRTGSLAIWHLWQGGNRSEIEKNIIAEYTNSKIMSQIVKSLLTLRYLSSIY